MLAMLQYLSSIGVHFGALCYRVNDDPDLGTSQWAFQPWPLAPTVWCDDCGFSHTTTPTNETEEAKPDGS